MAKPVDNDAAAQRSRFEATARAVGADESADSLDRAMARLDLKAKPKPDHVSEPQTKDRADG